MEPILGTAARPDAERLACLKRLVQVIEQHSEPGRFAVDVELDPVGHARAVVGQQHVSPSAVRQALRAFHAQGVVQPTLDQVDVNPAPLERQGIAFGLGRIDHAGEHRAAALILRKDPCAAREFVNESPSSG